VHENLRTLGPAPLDVVNLRSMMGTHGPADGAVACDCGVRTSADL
jgi:hypothetical protein